MEQKGIFLWTVGAVNGDLQLRTPALVIVAFSGPVGSDVIFVVEPTIGRSRNLCDIFQEIWVLTFARVVSQRVLAHDFLHAFFLFPVSEIPEVSVDVQTDLSDVFRDGVADVTQQSMERLIVGLDRTSAALELIVQDYGCTFPDPEKLEEVLLSAHNTLHAVQWPMQAIVQHRRSRHAGMK